MVQSKHRRWRRPLAVALVVAGGLFIWLAPDERTGIGLLIAGVILEIAGITLEQHTDR